MEINTLLFQKCFIQFLPPFQIFLYARDTFTCNYTCEVRTCVTQALRKKTEKRVTRKKIITRLVEILTYFHERRYLSNECTLNKV